MIKVENLSVSYGKGMPDIIQNMTFELRKGNILNVLGQNAVGKTTLIRTLTRELQNYSGSVRINGNEIGTYSIQEYARIIGVVSTSSSIFQNLLVADYLITGFINDMSPFSNPNEKYVQKAYDVLESFGKQDLFNKPIDQLSSGERQIVMIARVLLQNPEIIIVDEPTANLDVKNQITVLNQIKKLSEQGYTVIVTTHNPGHAHSLGGKTLMMGKGKYCFGDTDEIITAENLSQYYDLKVAIHCEKGTKDIQCMVFQNQDDSCRIRLVF